MTLTQAVVIALIAPSAEAATCIGDVAGGGFHSLALLVDGSVWAWGGNDHGALGVGFISPFSAQPLRVPGLSDVTMVSAGSDTSFALRIDGTLWSWGLNNVGQLGINSTVDSYSPVPIAGLPSVVAVSAGHDHALALAADGTIWAWGHNKYGALGDGSFVDRPAPVAVLTLTDAIGIAAGPGHSLALKSDRTVWSWGRNAEGQLGNGTWGPGTDSNVPSQVSGIDNVVKLSAGGEMSYALRQDGTLWAWGGNGIGALGDGTNNSSNVPVQVMISGVRSIGTAGTSKNWGRALKSDGTVWTWGTAADGRLGDGTGTNSIIPVRAVGLSGIRKIAGGGAHGFALGQGNVLWAWGLNFTGQLGNGNNTSVAIPTKLVGGIFDDETVPLDQGNVLRATRVAGVDVLLAFPGATAFAWRAYYDLDPSMLGTAALSPDVTTSQFLHSNAVVDPPSLGFYRIKGLSLCSHLPGD